MNAESQRDVLQCVGCNLLVEDVVAHMCLECSSATAERTALEAVIGIPCYPACLRLGPADEGFALAVRLASPCDKIACQFWSKQ